MHVHADPSYNYFLVALSYCVAVFGSYTALQMVAGIVESKNKYRWIVGSAIALGGGAIWTMHFIGMIAYEMDMPVGYDPFLTFVSLFIAVVIVGIGLAVVGSDHKSLPKLLVAGFVTGLGVASMHYAGMAAMIMPADTEYNNLLVAISIVIAIIASMVALWLAFNLTGNLQRLGSAFVMGAAVCGMHYTGMAGMTMVPNGSQVSIDSTMEPLTLGLFIFCFSMLLLVLCLIVALANLNRKMYEQMEQDFDDDEAGEQPV